MLVELLVRPYRYVIELEDCRPFLNLAVFCSETWGIDFAAGDQDGLFAAWQELLGVAVARSTSKGVSGAVGVYDPFALLMQEMNVEVDDSRYAFSDERVYNERHG
jgi:hypothetical protein